jgi:hypothetical protein
VIDFLKRTLLNCIPFGIAVKHIKKNGAYTHHEGFDYYEYGTDEFVSTYNRPVTTVQHENISSKDESQELSKGSEEMAEEKQELMTVEELRTYFGDSIPIDVFTRLFPEGGFKGNFRQAVIEESFKVRFKQAFDQFQSKIETHSKPSNSGSTIDVYDVSIALTHLLSDLHTSIDIATDAAKRGNFNLLRDFLKSLFETNYLNRVRPKPSSD